MYKICSWDIGIKTLSYCVFEIDKENKTWKIIDWNIINLLQANKHQCIGKLKNNNPCKSNAILYGKNYLNQEYFLCKSHKKLYNKEFNEDTITEIIDNAKCEYQAKNICNKKANIKINNMILCNQHKKVMLSRIQNELELKPIKKIKCTSLDPQNICKKLYQELRNKNIMNDINEVLIENQPSLINPIMKSISSFVFSYYVFTDNMDNRNIKFIAPSNKLNLDINTIHNICININQNDKLYLKIQSLLNVNLEDYQEHKINILKIVILCVLDKKIINYMYNNKIKIEEPIINIIEPIKKYLGNDKPFLKNISQLYKKIETNTKKKTSNDINNVINVDKNNDVNNDDINNNELDKAEGSGTKVRYDIIKLLAIKYTCLLLINDNKWCNYIENFQKKDDVCDAFLHGYNYLVKKILI
ncbi:holliday junction resolvase [Hokovirus HKV1]|uniref:Holliday junction resolvase n=1 Tax=Hokovirus HKV1 TaxID=1977638 RepID=A0A1V0SFV7_9VIRU|nr:holliday junction resolvase [Hokovirus HKV1]